jgi:hypothetical protein
VAGAPAAMAATTAAQPGAACMVEVVMWPIVVTVTKGRRSDEATVEAYFQLPRFGWIEVGRVHGNLTDGITMSIGYPDDLTGTLEVQQVDESAVLNWDFTAYGVVYTGSAPVTVC